MKSARLRRLIAGAVRTHERFQADPWGTWVAIVLMCSVLGYLLDPAALEETAMGILLGQWAWLWAVMLIVAALAMLFGKASARGDVEVLGLTWFGAATSVYAVVVIYVSGFRGLAATGIFLGTAWACHTQAHRISALGKRMQAHE